MNKLQALQQQLIELHTEYIALCRRDQQEQASDAESRSIKLTALQEKFDEVSLEFERVKEGLAVG